MNICLDQNDNFLLYLILRWLIKLPIGEGNIIFDKFKIVLLLIKDCLLLICVCISPPLTVLILLTINEVLLLIKGCLLLICVCIFPVNPYR